MLVPGGEARQSVVEGLERTSDALPRARLPHQSTCRVHLQGFRHQGFNRTVTLRIHTHINYLQLVANSYHATPFHRPKKKPRALINMPYDRDQVVASVTDFYVFLTTYLHFQPSGLKIPPPTGWPQITQARFAFLGKSDKVIDLLQHLPYLPRGEDDKEIYDHTVCVDYTHEIVDEKQDEPELCITQFFEPEDELLENCPYDKFKEAREHIVVLGMPEVVRASN